MGYTKPAAALSRHKPLARVLSTPLLLSTVAQLKVVVLFQLIALAALAKRPGYERSHGRADITDVVAPENFVVYVLGLAQFMVLARCLSRPFACPRRAAGRSPAPRAAPATRARPGLPPLRAPCAVPRAPLAAC